jgi:hypothetical protein
VWQRDIGRRGDDGLDGISTLPLARSDHSAVGLAPSFRGGVAVVNEHMHSHKSPVS